MANSYLEDELIREQVIAERHKADLFQTLNSLALTLKTTLKRINILLVKQADAGNNEQTETE